jgi:hypothetical protein
MRFKLGLLTGFGAGYYLGARAGRERYEQINESLRKLRRSDAFETVSDTVTSAASEGADKAQNLVENKVGNGQGDETPSRTLP